MATHIAQTVTIKDILKGLESMEAWTRQMRDALALIDQGQRQAGTPALTLAAVPRMSPKKNPPRIAGGVCPPPPPDKPKPRPKKNPPKKK
jgi:hypothetical protein